MEKKLDSINLKNIKRRISVEKLTNQIHKKNKLDLLDVFNKIIIYERIIECYSLVKKEYQEDI